MQFKQIENKEDYLNEHYPFLDVPKLTDTKYCIHCSQNIIVGNYKVEIENNEEYIVCANAPKCDGTVIDWINAK
jgi:hypothetical protein